MGLSSRTASLTSRRLILGIGTIAGLAAVAVVAASWIGPGDPVARAQAAASRGDWPEVVAQAERRLNLKAPGDVVAHRLRARGLAHLGRNAEAREAYLRSGVESMPIEDYLLLASGLEKDGRPALAWLALEAAGRIDPKNADVRAAMTKLHGTVGSRG